MIYRFFILCSASIFFILSGCALPQPTNVERQDFLSKKEVVLARILRDAQADYNKGRLLDSELSLRQALLLAPDTTQIVLNLGRVLARNGQLEEAEEFFLSVLKRKEHDGAILNLAGEAFFESGDYTRAKKYFERAKMVVDESLGAESNALTPDADLIDRTLRNVSTVYFREGDLIGALCLMDQAYARRASFDNVARLARIELALGDYWNAENRLTSFLTTNVGFSDGRLYLLRAIARLASDQKDKAIEDINAAAKRDDTIAEYGLEYRILSEILIVPEDGEDSSEGDTEESSIEEFSSSQRLYLPAPVLRRIDQYEQERRDKLEAES